MPHLDEQSDFSVEHFEPLHDRVVIKHRETEAKAGSIIIPDTAREKYNEGWVMACGQGFRTADGNVEPLQVKPGDYVIFARYGGTAIEIGEETYTIMQEREIHGIVRRSDDAG